MTTIYKIYTDQENEVLYFARKQDAIKAANRIAQDASEAVDVEACQVVKMGVRETYVALLSGGWAAKRTVIYTANPPQTSAQETKP